MIKTAVIGHPISHSKSPAIHNHWIKEHGLNGEYTAIDIHPDTLEEDIKTLIEQGFAGFNVTVPHKESIMKFCETIDDAATQIGAVNTVVIDKNGKLHGKNTDAFGFMENIHQNAPDFDITGKTAYVIGAGGAAKAVVYALHQNNIGKILITNRTREKAETFKNVEIIEWENREEPLSQTDILINTTSLGMKNMPPLDLDIGTLHKTALVTDIVYNPLDTDLLKSAENQGNQTVTGIGMLIHQARPAFKEWYGVMPEPILLLKKLAQ